MTYEHTPSQSSFNEVSGETPSLESFTELRDIMTSFGIDAAFFDSATPTAQVFLVGQHTQVKQLNDELMELKRYVHKLEADLRRIRGQRNSMLALLKQNGMFSPDFASAERSQEVEAMTESIKHKNANADAPTTRSIKKPQS